MEQFSTVDELRAAWVRREACEQFTRGPATKTNREARAGYDDAVAVAEISARSAAVYVPHLYRGGWVIRGFGYSVERVGRYVEADAAGSPYLV